MSEPEPPRDQLLEEAATWFARMRGPDAEESRGAFEAWLRRGALHRAAYNRASEIFSMGKFLAEDGPGETQPAVRADEPAPEGRRRRLGAAAMALLVLVAAGLVALRLLAAEPHAQRLAHGAGSPALASHQIVTAPRQRERVRLADGSIVSLEADTAIDVGLDSSQRRLALRRGRVRVEVFHEPRPFVVDIGGGQVVARGTVFEVGLGADRRVVVRLVSGAVDVILPRPREARGAGNAARRLRPGETLSYVAAQVEPAAATGAPAAHSGRAAAPSAMDHQGAEVSALVAAANRESARPIRLADPRIGSRRVSGRFRTDDTLVLAERLAALFDLSVEAGPDEIVLRRR